MRQERQEGQQEDQGEPGAGRWWEEHIHARIAEDRRVIARQEVRAHVLAGICGSAVLGGSALLERGFFSGIGWLPGAALLGGVSGLIGATCAFALLLWPLEGSRFLAGSVESRIYRGLLSGRGGAWVPTRCTHALAPDLAGRLDAVRRREELPPSQIARSAEARRMAAAWLSERLHTDIGWWLDGEQTLRTDIRFHLAMMCWAADQQAQAKAMLLQTGMRLGAISAGLLLLAGALSMLGGWGWLLAAALAAWGLVRWLEIDLKL